MAASEDHGHHLDGEHGDNHCDHDDDRGDHGDDRVDHDGEGLCQNPAL